MSLSRAVRHAFTTRARLRRWFPPATLARIRDEIALGERTHAGEVCFAVESRLPLRDALAGRTARERAADVFSRLRVWDTERNSGVLIYALLAERSVEILADRGIASCAAELEWRALCALIAEGFRADAPATAVLEAIARIHALLARHFPAAADNPRELSDEPRVL